MPSLDVVLDRKAINCCDYLQIMSKTESDSDSVSDLELSIMLRKSYEGLGYFFHKELDTIQKTCAFSIDNSYLLVKMLSSRKKSFQTRFRYALPITNLESGEKSKLDLTPALERIDMTNASAFSLYLDGDTIEKLVLIEDFYGPEYGRDDSITNTIYATVANYTRHLHNFRINDELLNDWCAYRSTSLS